MKNMMRAGTTMAGIIAIEMMLSHVFNDKVGKAFSRGAVIALFFHYGLKLIKGREKLQKEIE